MTDVPDIELGTLQRDEISLVAEMAARGMLNNPSSVALFGEDPVRRLRALEPTYHWVLASVERPSLVARRNGVIVGLAALSPPDRCFFRQIVGRERTLQLGSKRLSVTVPNVPRNLILPLLLLGPTALSHLSAWGEAGLEHDPSERHQHVELVVVEAALQGLSIGRLMMDALCREMDKIRDVSYLETDKPENVRFYEHFGFEVIEEATVLGIRNWYMQRRPADRG